MISQRVEVDHFINRAKRQAIFVIGLSIDYQAAFDFAMYFFETSCFDHLQDDLRVQFLLCAQIVQIILNYY